MSHQIPMSHPSPRSLHRPRPGAWPPGRRTRHALNNHLMVVLFHAEGLVERLAGRPEGEDAVELLAAARAISALLQGEREREAA